MKSTKASKVSMTTTAAQQPSQTIKRRGVHERNSLNMCAQAVKSSDASGIKKPSPAKAPQ